MPGDLRAGGRGGGDRPCRRARARDELRDRHYLIVDGIDGRSRYHIDIGQGNETEALPPGAIVRITSRLAAVRKSDRRIAGIAAVNHGRYSAGLHRAAEEGTATGFAEAHIRRLEAIGRRIGGIERNDEGSWTIPPDFLDRARRYEALRSREAPVAIELLSPVPLELLSTMTVRPGSTAS